MSADVIAFAAVLGALCLFLAAIAAVVAWTFSDGNKHPRFHISGTRVLRPGTSDARVATVTKSVPPVYCRIERRELDMEDNQ